MFDRLLSEEWVEVPLGSLAQLRRGITYSTDLLGSDENGLPYINMKSFLKGGGFNLKGGKEYSGKYQDEDLILENDLLIANTDVTSGDIIGSPALLPDEFRENKVLYSHHVTRLRLNEKITANFLSHLLRLPLYRKYMLQNARGTTVLMLDMAAVKKIPIKYPADILVQEKICRILDTLDTQIRQTEAIIAKLQQVKQGLLHDLLTRGIDESGQLRPPYEQAPELYKDSPLGWIPKEWEYGSVESFLECIIDYRGKTPEKTDSGIPLITAKNVRLGFIDPYPREFIATEAYHRWMTRGIPKFTDILYTTEAPLGMVAQVGTNDKVAFAQRLIILRPKNSLEPSLLKYRLLTSQFQRSAIKKASGSTALGIKQSEFRKITTCFPQGEWEQKEIVARLGSIEKEEQRLIENLDKLKKAKPGLMDDLLTGRVRVTELIEQEQQAS